jgi:hypothetical protein
MRELYVETLGRVSLPDAPELVHSLPDREVTLTYPTATPDTYLRWLAYFREVEVTMLEHPHLAKLALRETGPFVSGPVAGFISTTVGHLSRQALEASAAGLRSVTPTVSGNARLLAESVLLAERRNAWLEAEVSGRPLVEILGIEPLDREGHSLRTAAIARVRQQLIAIAESA